MIGVFVAAAVVLGALYLAGPYLPGSLSDAAFWNLNSERGLGTWYSAMQIALIGVLLLGFAALRFRESKRSTVVFGIAGVGALFLSLDEQARLHERFARYIDSTTFGSDLGLDRSGPWMLVVAPAFLAAFALLAFLARRDLRGRPLVGWLFLAGTLLFAAAFAGMEVVRNFTSFGTALDRVMTVCEEGGEMLGATLVLWGAYELLRSHGIAVLARCDGRSPGATERHARRGGA